MQRIGEDVSENLDVIPARFFVYSHTYGKWACRCCQQIRHEPAEPDVVDGGIPASGLVAHTLISRFVDYLPYYRQEPINARSGVHTPRSTLATGQVHAAADGTRALHEGLSGDLAQQMVQQFCDEHPERYLLAFVYGHLGEHDLLRVHTDAEKYLVMAALNLAECIADVEPKTSA